MSRVKQILALILVSCFALTLVACGGDDAKKTDTTTAKPTNAAVAVGQSTTAEGETTTTTGGKVNNKSDKTTTTTKRQNVKKVPDLRNLVARTKSPASSFTKSLKGFTLKILYPWENIYGNRKCQTYAEKAIAAVEKQYGVKISEKGQFARYSDSLSAEFAANKFDNHIYYAYNSDFASYFSKGYLSDLTPAMRETGTTFTERWYISEARNFLNIDGKQYGWIAAEDEYTLPFCIIYNSKLLKQKNLADPAQLAAKGQWTWDKLEEYAKKFKNDANTGFYCGSSTMLLTAIANQYGTTLTKVKKGAQPTTNINDSKVKTALDTLRTWTVGKGAWATPSIGNQWTAPKNALREGKVAMYYGTHDDIKELASSSDNSIYGIAPFPNKTASKSYTGVSVPQFIGIIPKKWSSDVAKIVFIRDEYYRQNDVYTDRNFQYKWETYLGDQEAIDNAADIKYARNGNRIIFDWTSICETGKTQTGTIIGQVVKGSKTAAQAISANKNALVAAYKKVWDGHKTTGNV